MDREQRVGRPTAIALAAATPPRGLLPCDEAGIPPTSPWQLDGFTRTAASPVQTGSAPPSRTGHFGRCSAIKTGSQRRLTGKVPASCVYGGSFTDLRGLLVRGMNASGSSVVAGEHGYPRPAVSDPRSPFSISVSEGSRSLEDGEDHRCPGPLVGVEVEAQVAEERICLAHIWGRGSG